MTDNMDAMMADGLLRTVREAANLLYGENQTYPCDDVKRMKDDVGRLRAALEKICDGPRDADLDYLDLFVEVKMEARAALEGK